MTTLPTTFENAFIDFSVAPTTTPTTTTTYVVQQTPDTPPSPTTYITFAITPMRTPAMTTTILTVTTDDDTCGALPPTNNVTADAHHQQCELNLNPLQLGSYLHITHRPVDNLPFHLT
nr:unnamed protein product [Spirometra erinaceieuropaei]